MENESRLIWWSDIYCADEAFSLQRPSSCHYRVFRDHSWGLVDGEVGRGYSDLCAALVAAALNAKGLQIWKEIDGIFTADPAKVPTARLLHTITPLEAAELTFYGSEVIHPFTIEQVTQVTPPINVRIKNVRNPRGHGTIIVSDPKLRVDHFFPPPDISKSVNETSKNRKDQRLLLSKTRYVWWTFALISGPYPMVSFSKSSRY